MAKEKKRLSKNAKAALKILNDSKLLANVKVSEAAAAAAQNFETESPTSKTSAAIKPRPDKKRG